MGEVDDNGLFPGKIKLDGAGGRSFAESLVGIEKSLI